MIKISKTILSGADPGYNREQAQGLAPGPLRELAVPGRFTRQPAAIPAQTIPAASAAALQDAARLIRAILWDASHATG